MSHFLTRDLFNLKFAVELTDNLGREKDAQ
jgi:hypothetical protein